MPRREDCIDEMLRRAGRRMSRDQAERIMDDIDEEAQERMRGGESPGEAYARARDRRLDEEARRQAIRKRNIRLDALRARDLNRFGMTVLGRQELGTDAARLAAEAPLVGVNTPLFDAASGMGNQLSAASRGLGKKVDWIGGVILDLERQGLDKVLYSRRLENEIFREKYEVDRRAEGRSHAVGVTRSAEALRIAETLHKWDKVRTDQLNSVGAWITHYAGRMFRTTWDPNKIRRASRPYSFTDPANYLYKGFAQADREVWVGKMLNWLDLRRTFGTSDRAEAEQQLAHMYGGMIDGSYMQPALAEDMANVSPHPARQVSEKREFHFKDAQSALAANRDFGMMSPTDTWLHDMAQDADRWGLMKVFGTRPKEGFEQYLAMLKDRTAGTAQRAELDKWDLALRNRFAWVSGEAKRPIVSTWSGIINDWLAIQRMAKLGLTPFAMLQDNTTVSRELARQGINFFERNGSMITDYFQGAPDSAKRKVAALLHTGIMERIGGATARWDIGDARNGMMAKLENFFFKWSGITPMTANKRAGAERMMAQHLGDQRGKVWGDLGDAERRMMESFGLGEKEWSLLHQAEWNTLDGTTYLTPDVASRLTDAHVRAYLAAREVQPGIAPMSATQAALRFTPDMVRETRTDLANKLWSYFAERGNYAVLEVGPREKAMIYGNPAQDNFALARRLLLQFKQFPVATITRAWGADVYGGEKGLGRIAGVSEFVVMSTLFGMMANWLNSIVKGQDPNAVWRNNPANAILSGFTRGGAASIYGDLLLGEWSRFGSSAANTLLGPTFGQVDKAFELYTDLTKPVHMREFKGPQTAALALKWGRENTPFMNMILTKYAFDYAIYWRMMEHISPGWAERYERTMRQNAGIEFLPGAGPMAVAH